MRVWKRLRIECVGPKTGGDYGPYVQSERLELYRRYAEVLIRVIAHESVNA